MLPRLAVVLCTRNRPERLARVLADLEGQGADDVVVVDQSDAPRPVGGVRHVVDEGRGLPRARNLGLAHTDAELVLFLDDDVRLLPGCVAAHRRAYEDPRVGGVVGRIIERSVRPNAPRTTNRLDRAGRVRTNLEGQRRAPIETLKGANMSFRRAALAAAGPFDEGYAGTAFLEDADMSARVARLGWRLVFEPDAALVHPSEPTGGVRVGDRLRTEWWRFHNTGRFVRRHRGRLAIVPTVGVFAAVAVRRAAEWRRPDAAGALLAALLTGWRGARPIRAAPGSPSAPRRWRRRRAR